ncbi:hypothetical protein MATL_G00032670 [Megalops atlanticus]|uniref:Uncharacterized protein n=1 Tax=Megalops atlanticus TaxID=7932 RepID=A0A9D3TIH2_MEGAT|nr:hypothetical protein MATL_G00032670 [Megalops atlanticus]
MQKVFPHYDCNSTVLDLIQSEARDVPAEPQRPAPSRLHSPQPNTGTDTTPLLPAQQTTTDPLKMNIVNLSSALFSGASMVNEIIQHSASAGDRSVSIHLTNHTKTYILVNPQVYTHSGYCYNPPQPTVKEGIREICSFTKTTGTACGAVGVLTYDIANDCRKTLKRLAIMFSVPFDYSYYENWFALGFFGTDRACDESLYKLMYNENDGTFTRTKALGTENSHTSTDKKYTLRGTMTPMAKAVLKVEVWEED